jgi:uncharacterized hydrophobic protein (TIGR00271 family)
MIEKVIKFFDLHSGEEDKKKVLENVKSNISFRGSNLWILACAIVIASVGLNVNSTAVIIGAMLISPLMGPIVGAGFGLGTFDFVILKKSLKNLLIATIVGLIVSAIYFFLSPFKETQSELLSRTSPTIYDVLIAFFGGLVGVIATTRVEKGNPIPGVAIATALMPPLCTAGYGLAIGNLNYFLGAIFLYTINCVFICISTFVIVKYLKYPAANFVDIKDEKKIKIIIYSLVIALILPSIFFAYQLIQEKKYTQKIDEYINTEFKAKGYTLIYKNVNTKSSPKIIEVAFLSKKFNINDINKLNADIKNYGIKDTKLVVKQDTTDLKKNILNEINMGKNQLDQKDVKIANLEKIIKQNTYDNNAILGEVKILFPEINSLSISNHFYNENTDSLKVIPVMIYKCKTAISDASKEKLTLWLEKRLDKKKVEIFREENK